MSLILVAIVAALAQATPAPGLLSYGFTPLTSRQEVEGHTFVVNVHPKVDNLLVQPALGEMSHNPSKWPMEAFRAAAVQFVKPLGCDISDIAVHGSRSSGSWDARYVCPQGVDLKATAFAERAQLKRGEPLSPLPSPSR